MASCALNNFITVFPELHNKGVKINITDFPNKNQIIDYVEKANYKAQVEGFNHELFNIEYKRPKAVTGHSNSRFNKPQVVRLTINEQNLDDYNYYVEEYLNPQTELQKDRAREYLETSFDLDNKESNQALMDQGEAIFNDIDDALYSSHDSTGNEHKEKDPDPNYFLWRESMEDILYKAEETKKRLLSRRENRSKIRELNAMIKRYKKDIKDFDDTSESILKTTVMGEIEDLSRLLDMQNDDPIALAQIIETNQIRERIDILRDTFLATADGKIPTEMNEYFRTNIEDLDSVIRALDDVSAKMSNSMGAIMYGIVMNNDYVQQRKREMTKPEQIAQWESLHSMIKDLLNSQNPATWRDGDSFFGLNFLGAEGYDNILINILTISRDIQQQKEAGITSLMMKKMKSAYEKVSKVRLPNGELLIDEIFMKDDMGNTLSTLLSPFSREHFQNIGKINSFRAHFNRAKDNSTEQEDAYGHWMDQLKDKVDFIDMTKIASFVASHTERGTTEFIEYFTHDAEEMKSYETEMRKKMGDIAFELELQNQREHVENFLADEFETSLEAKNKNPLRFVKNFYSENFDMADTETGEFLLPQSDYLRFVPAIKNQALYNDKFRNIEKANIEGFKDFYNSTSALMKYYKEAGEASGQEMKVNEIPNLVSNLGRNALADLSFFGKIGANLVEAWRATFKVFYTGFHENPDNYIFYNPETDRGFANNMSDYGSKEINKLVKLLLPKSLAEVSAKVREEGLHVPAKFFHKSGAYVHEVLRDKKIAALNKRFEDGKLDQKKLDKRIKLVYAESEKVEDFIKAKLIHGIATKRMNKHRSMDLVQRISMAVASAESVNVRLGVRGMTSLIKDYADSQKLPNTLAFAQFYEAKNILKVGSMQVQNTFTKIERRKLKKLFFIFKTKKYTSAERIFREFLDREAKNLEDTDSFNFIYKYYDDGGKKSSTRYFGKDGEYFFQEEGSEATTKLIGGVDEMRRLYGEYLKQELDQLGKEPTVGMIVSGLAYNMFRGWLYNSLGTYFGNRFPGSSQNRQLAATGKYGITNSHLIVANRFLSGYGRNQFLGYITKAPIFGPTHKKKQEQWMIMNHLADRLKLLDLVAQDVFGGEGTDLGISGGRLYDKLGQLALELPMGIPEVHNQMAPFIAYMQTVEIEQYDENGDISPVKVKLFDAKTMKFNIDPNTMELLPKFRTPNNIENWEKFRADSTGNNPIVSVVQKFKTFRSASQGNYNVDDPPRIQGTMSGTVATAFTKWAFGNTRVQYGKRKGDLVTLDVNYKGRKLVLMEHIPTMLTHFVLANVGVTTLIGGTIALTQGAQTMSMLGYAGIADIFTGGIVSSILAGGALAIGAAGVIKVGYLMYQHRKSTEAAGFQMEELKLMGQYMGEVIYKVLSATAVTTTKYVAGATFGLTKTSNLGLSDERLRRIMKTEPGVFNSGIMTASERAEISANAQEIADKYQIFLVTAINISILNGLIFLSRLLMADDDEEKLSWLQKLINEERAINKLFNIRNSAAQEGEKFSNPMLLASTHNQVALLSFVESMIETPKRAEKLYANGKINSLDREIYWAESVLATSSGFPLRLSAAATSDRNYFGDKRIYDLDSQTFLDAHFQYAFANKDEVAAKRLKSLVNRTKEDIVRQYTKEIRNNLKESNPELSSAEMDKKVREIALKNADFILRQNGARDFQKGTEQEVLENLNPREIVKSAKEFTPVMTDKKIGGKSSSKKKNEGPVIKSSGAISNSKIKSSVIK